MDYYEELGLAPAASDEEIRRAHRTLSKVLHPDRQTDPAAREAAELQMRRLNAMVDALLDPRRRREYDASLHADPLAPVFQRPDPRVPPRKRRILGPVSSLLLTVSAGLLLTIAAAWFLGGDLLHFESPGNRAAAVTENAPPAVPPPAAPTPHDSRHAVVPVASTGGPQAQPSRHTVQLPQESAPGDDHDPVAEAVPQPASTPSPIAAPPSPPPVTATRPDEPSPRFRAHSHAGRAVAVCSDALKTRPDEAVRARVYSITHSRRGWPAAWRVSARYQVPEPAHFRVRGVPFRGAVRRRSFLRLAGR